MRVRPERAERGPNQEHRREDATRHSGGDQSARGDDLANSSRARRPTGGGTSSIVSIGWSPLPTAYGTNHAIPPTTARPRKRAAAAAIRTARRLVEQLRRLPKPTAVTAAAVPAPAERQQIDVRPHGEGTLPIDGPGPTIVRVTTVAMALAAMTGTVIVARRCRRWSRARRGRPRTGCCKPRRSPSAVRAAIKNGFRRGTCPGGSVPPQGPPNSMRGPSRRIDMPPAMAAHDALTRDAVTLSERCSRPRTTASTTLLTPLRERRSDDDQAGDSGSGDPDEAVKPAEGDNPSTTLSDPERGVQSRRARRRAIAKVAAPTAPAPMPRQRAAAGRAQLDVQRGHGGHPGASAPPIDPGHCRRPPSASSPRACRALLSGGMLKARAEGVGDGMGIVRVDRRGPRAARARRRRMG